MSSMAEGSEGWTPEDELDLGPNDDQIQLSGQGGSSSSQPSAPPPIDEELDRMDAVEEASETTIGPPDDTDLPQTPPQQRKDAGTVEGSLNERAYTPDDSPSLHDSVLSSQSGNALPFRGSPRVSPSPAHRPFDLRFQSRLSSSPLSASRTGSPFLAHIHSRQSSITSQVSPTPDSEPDFPQSPWDVVRWTKLRKITGQAFSEVGRRNFGRPTCLAVSTSIVIGTSKGIILVFDYQQSLKTIIGTGTQAVERGSITSLALSADHSTVAGGHEMGDVFTWEIARSARPFLHIPPIPATQLDSRTVDGHIEGSSIIHIGFLGTRRTALVSADTKGMAFSHLATRGMGAVGRTVKTARILGRYPENKIAEVRPRKPSSVLAFSPLPLGNVEQPSDSLGLVAMLTPYLLVIVSTTPVAQTQHKAPRPKEVPAHSAMTGALAWFPAIRLKGKDSQTSNTKLAYCWSNVLTVLEVTEAETDEPEDKDRPPNLVFKARSRWKADEAIVAVQWLSRSVLAVFTITQRLLILEDYSMHVTDSIDLVNRHVYHADLFSSQLHTLVEQLDEEDTSMHGVVADAFYMSFRAYKGRLFLLGYNETLVGSLSNWADRLLALMEAGDFIGAIRLATSYYTGAAEKLTVGLPEEDSLRQPIVQEKLLEMISASLKYAFGRNVEADGGRLENSQLEELAETSITACIHMADEEFLWEEVFNWYEENDAAGVFLEVLEPRIIDGVLRSLPPTAVKALINHFIVTHSPGRLEEIICLLDTTTMDIDQVTTLCKKNNLYDAYIYVWNRCLADYVGPLEELLNQILSQAGSLTNGDHAVQMNRHINAMKIFPYLSFVLTGRIYPTGEDMEDSEASRAKTALYQYLFSGQLSDANSSNDSNEVDSFSQLRALLKFDASSFMSMLNEAFEDSFLNDSDFEEVPIGVSVNRQYLISILLQVMNASCFSPDDTIYLDMFVARNLPKYPQYILLSGTTLHQVLVRLCQYPQPDLADDCELSAEYLLSFYHPPDIQSMVPLFKEAQFFRILKSTYRSEKQYSNWILTFLEDPIDKDDIFTALHDCLRSGSSLGKKHRRDVIDVVQEHAREIASIDVQRAAHTMQALAPETHSTFLEVLQDNAHSQYRYLLVLIEPVGQGGETRPEAVENWMLERYVQLLCKFKPSHVAEFVDGLRVSDIHLDALLPAIEQSGAIDAAVILLARQGQLRAALDRLIAHLSTLESGLIGILQSAVNAPDSTSAAEAIDDLLESLHKYAGVGTWLCQGQTKTAKQTSANGPSPRAVQSLEQPLAFDENLWLDLIEAVVRIASNVFSILREHQNQGHEDPKSMLSVTRDGDRLTATFRTLVQQIFSSLLASTVKGGRTTAANERTDMSFLRILRAFLTRAASWSPSLLELRAVLASIFSAYSYEKSLLTLANGMLDRDLFVHVDEVTRLRQHGWRPRGQVCEICRRRIWGPNIGSLQWTAWHEKQASERQRRIAKRVEEGYDPASERGKGKAAATVGVDQSISSFAGPINSVDREHEAEDDPDHEDGAPRLPEPPLEPAVIFSCRHLYHRKCVLDTVQTHARPTTVPAFRNEHPDWSGAELFCPACT